MKLILILLLVGVLVISGCSQQPEQSPGATPSPGKTISETPYTTPEIKTTPKPTQLEGPEIEVEFKDSSAGNFAGSVESGLYIKQTGGPSGGTIKFGMASSKSNPNIIYVDKYKSVDDGESWKKLNFPGDGAVHNIAVDPNNPDIVFAVSNNVIWKSINGGNSWTNKGSAGPDPESEGWNGRVASSLTINPSNPSAIFVGTTHGDFYKSEDSGETWKDISGKLGTEKVISRISINPENSKEIFVSTGSWYWSTLVNKDKSGDGVFRSMDGGETFNKVGGEFSSALVEDIDSIGNLVVLQAHFNPDGQDAEKNVVYKSTDSGAKWNKILDSKEQGVDALTHVTINPSDKNHIVASGTNQIPFFVSFDGGQNWKKVGLESSEFVQYTHELEILNTREVRAIGYYNIFMKSLDKGEHWTWSSEGIRDSSVYALEVHPNNRNHVLAVTGDSAIHKTFDGGDIWERSPSGLHGRKIAAINFDPSNPEILYFGVIGGFDLSTGRYYGGPADDTGLYFSEDGGKTWKKTGPKHPNSNEDVEVYYILVHPDNPDLILIGTASEGVYRSEDRGRTWKEANNGIPNEGFYWQLNLQPEGYTPREHCETEYEKFKRGERYENGCFYFATKTSMSLFVSPHNKNEIWYTTLNGVFVSKDSGKTWSWLSDDLKNIHVHFMAFDPKDGNTVYMGTHQGAIGPDGKVIDSSKGLLISRDSGKTWRQVVDGPGQGLDVRAVAVSPDDPNVVVVGTNNPLFISRDKGETWSKIEVGELREADKIIIDSTAKVIYLGTGQKGVWRGIINYNSESPSIIEITGVSYPKQVSLGKEFEIIVSVDNLGSQSGRLDVKLRIGDKEAVGSLELFGADQSYAKFKTIIRKVGAYDIFVNGLYYGEINAA